MTNEVYNDIDEALELIKYGFLYHYKDFSKYSSIYPFTNENLSSYFKRVDLKGKSVLSVAGSGDHYLEALIRGSKSIKLFDINILTKYYLELKIAAIKALEYDEFMDFFILENNFYNTFNLNSYSKIRKYLTGDNQIFWDTLYQKFNGYTIRKSELFFKTEESYNFLRNFVSYFHPNNYYAVKKAILSSNNNITDIFYNCNITKIHSICGNDKFDAIFLSNIADYLDEIYKTEPAKRFKNYILNHLDKSLNEDGIIFVAYMFFVNLTKQKNIPIINRDKIRETLFKKEFEEWFIDNSAVPNCTNDHLLVYKKTK